MKEVVRFSQSRGWFHRMRYLLHGELMTVWIGPFPTFDAMHAAWAGFNRIMHRPV